MRVNAPAVCCALCAIELYPGAPCYCFEGRRVCPACLGAYARILFRDALEVAE
ncbi:MAG: hypothetical protein IJZ52_06240 [Clostridium sp.]|nr:hypothetical protein [Clostridium sp.]